MEVQGSSRCASQKKKQEAVGERGRVAAFFCRVVKHSCDRLLTVLNLRSVDKTEFQTHLHADSLIQIYTKSESFSHFTAPETFCTFSRWDHTHSEMTVNGRQMTSVCGIAMLARRTIQLTEKTMLLA